MLTDFGMQLRMIRLDEIMETLIKHDEKHDKLTDMLGRVCEVKNANQTRT
ncbi:MAG: hypothetical protein [Bacteriophage sp.]|nr:MAG: hypothetical protein [Bacteriophage sp.]